MTQLKLALLLLVTLIATTALWHRYKPLPDGLAMHGEALPAHNLALFTDDTWQTPDGKRAIRQQIFDEVFRLIRQAKQQVVVDMFLLNDFQGSGTESYRALSSELIQALLDKTRQGVAVVLITDPINILYGGLAHPGLNALQKAGAHVIMTPLPALRDSNPAWSGLWRLCCQWLGNNPKAGGLPNPLGPGKVSLRSYLQLLNFKANHRKTLLVDDGQHVTALVTSANPHDGSSAHSNIALRFSGPAALALLESERAVARMANSDIAALSNTPPEASATDNAHLQVLTEGAIGNALLDTVARSQSGDSLDVAVFYLSHRPLVEALKAAQQRGVTVRVLLDPNKDAFGRKKNGIPNRQVGAELHDHGLAVRWCNTQGEQCHSKMLLHRGPAQSRLILGSANFTRRNLDNLNLETSIQLTAPNDHPIITEASAVFARRWENRDSQKHSTDYATYADHSLWKYGLYRVMEFTGISSF